MFLLFDRITADNSKPTGLQCNLHRNFRLKAGISIPAFSVRPEELLVDACLGWSRWLDSELDDMAVRPKLLHSHRGLLFIVFPLCRPLKIVGYADDKTKREFATTRGATLVMVKPDAHQQMGQVLELIYKSGLTVGRMRMVRFNDHDAERFLGASSSSSGSSAPSASAKRSLQGDAMLAIEVAGDDIIARVHELAGPADPADAKEAAPNSIRAIFGTSRDANAVHTSASIETGRSELAYIFDRSYPFTAVGTHCSALVIKPHAVEAKVTGKVLDAVLASGLEISALRK